MACQKVCNVKRCRDRALQIYLHYYTHPYLVCILFGMPSLHPFTFSMFFKSCFCTFLMLISVTVTPKPKNISFKCNSTTPELEIALTI